MATPKHTHVPPRLTRQNFQAGHLKPGAYAVEDIAAAIIDHGSSPEDDWTRGKGKE